MTPEEKAKELCNKFVLWYVDDERKTYNFKTKDAALMCCDEVLSALDKSTYLTVDDNGDDLEAYWQQVKQHITKL